MQDVGQMLGRFAMAKQEQVNRGLLAAEETVRMQTAAQVEAYAEQNQDKPETWDKFAEQTWQEYEKGRGQRAKAQGWGPSVRDADKMMGDQYRAQVGVRFNAKRDGAMIRQANARIMGNAQAKLRGGDYEGYVAAVEQMNLFPDQKEAMIRQGLEEGLYKSANNDLDAIRELPPAQAREAYREFKAQLKAKEGDKFRAWEYEKGGLSLGGRVNLESMANAREREAERQMDSTGRRLVAELRLGRATLADVTEAVQTGEMDIETAKALAPDLEMALGEREAKQAAAADAALSAQQAAADRIRDRAVTPGRAGDVGLRDIEAQMALGKISPLQADQLRTELEQTARAEQGAGAGDYAKISKRIKGGMASKLFGRQPDPDEYRRLQGEIIAAKVTKETRLKLMDELFALKLADIEDLQEEGDRWMDRKISPVERGLRRDMIEEYRRLAPALGDVLAGDLMFNQEARIREFFDTAERGRSQAEVKQFLREDLMEEARKAAGQSAIRDIYDF
jgi:hypothetical protein